MESFLKAPIFGRPSPQRPVLASEGVWRRCHTIVACLRLGASLRFKSFVKASVERTGSGVRIGLAV